MKDDFNLYNKIYSYYRKFPDLIANSEEESFRLFKKWNNMKKSDLKIYKNINDCYLALGIFHNKYSAIPGKFKDYISTPKINQYKLKNKVYPKGRSTMGMPGTKPRKAIKKWKPKK